MLRSTIGCEITLVEQDGSEVHAPLSGDELLRSCAFSEIFSGAASWRPKPGLSTLELVGLGLALFVSTSEMTTDVRECPARKEMLRTLI